MSFQMTSSDTVEAIIAPPIRNSEDGSWIRRRLPLRSGGMVGPFILLDQIGPTVFREGQGLDVKPHPHIGMTAITYLLEGKLLHRDSLGSVQLIRPGEVNWMTAGAGIVHSEGTPPHDRSSRHSLLGLQAWIALPTSHEEMMPLFSHYPAASLPRIKADGVCMTLIAGRCDGLVSPVPTYSDMFWTDIVLEPQARHRISAEHVERAVYVVAGHVEAEGRAGSFRAGELIVFKPGVEIVLGAEVPARFVVLGGEPLPERRHIDWNFVSSRTDRIVRAKEEWRAGRFATVPSASDPALLPSKRLSDPRP